MGVQGVDGGIIILILVGLNSWCVIYAFDQLNFGYFLDAKLVHSFFEVDREH